MDLKKFQTYVAKIMQIGYKLGKGEINKAQADLQMHDVMNYFADSMIKDPGLHIPDKGIIQ